MNDRVSRACRRSCQRLFIACLGVGLVSGCIRADTERVAELDTVSPEEAVAVCRPWADKLGIKSELRYLEARQRRGPFGAPLLLVHEVGSRDGEHEFRVRACSGAFVPYINRQVYPLGPGKVTKPPALSEQELASRRQEFAELLLPGLDLGSFMRSRTRWQELAGPEVLNGRSFSIDVDPSTRELADFGVHLGEVRASCEPGLSMDRCLDIALDTVGSWRGVRAVRIHEDAQRRGGRYYRVIADPAGVQRLVYVAYLSVYRRPPEKVVLGEPSRLLIWVDARTGECLNLETEGIYPPRSGDEDVPRLRIGEEPFGPIEPTFPPRIREGVPYIYVGYLESRLWQGEVQTAGNTASITYKDKEWRVTADSRTAMQGETATEFSHPPLVIQEYLYLPAEMIEAITGWHVD